jgi:dihydrofolate reductase
MNVFLIAAITVDGFIARDSDQISTSWTSLEDKKWFQDRTKQAGVVVMGNTTYATVKKPLPKRLNIVYSSQPQTNEGQPNLRFTSLEPEKLIEQLASEGYQEVAICGGASIYTMFLKAGVVNKMYLTVEPVVFGTGIKLFSEELNIKLKLEKVTQLSAQTLLLEYKV